MYPAHAVPPPGRELAAAVAGFAPAAPKNADEKDGPRSPQNRQRAETKVTTADGVHLSDVDLGDVEIGKKSGEFRSPVRGLLTLPVEGTEAAPLVVLSHLRHPNCADGSHAFPCPGDKDNRFDRGMAYLATDLAKKGYAVVVPDVGPLFMPRSLVEPYDQVEAWTKVVGHFLEKVRAATSGDDKSFGIALKGRIDSAKAALIAHSRSGQLAGKIVSAWEKGPTRISSVMTYAPSYQVEDKDKVTPMIPDVPYLALLGDKDKDVPYQAVNWLGHHLGSTRSQPALVGLLPGYGHNYVNRTLSAAGTDDRTACDKGCPDATAHEKLLVDAATRWLTSLREKADAEIPFAATAGLPEKLGDIPVSWLAHTNSPQRKIIFDATGRASGQGEHQLKKCTFYHPQNPEKHPDRCPEPEDGVVRVFGEVAQVKLTADTGASITTKVARTSHIALTLAPYGDRADKKKGTPLTVRLTTQDGTTSSLLIPAEHPALINRAVPGENGSYALSTIRMPLPPRATGQTVTKVELLGDSSGGTIALRQIDLISTR
ncbi:hypothetical protein AUCHE_16_01230 [Austwickia chelonae NBRC 105200]|uniref:Dienelactone hydrolase domain-containing protein n=1 Tax=Austwickia chelonae NBRC 105200 TaxID=1184607 RepID=K6V902_9MICO|nr:hypothetical protein AUCHE_16_01230 [Austwickia chelonae NBRC 105200]